MEYIPYDPENFGFCCSACMQDRFFDYLWTHVTDSTGSRKRAHTGDTLDYEVPTLSSENVREYCTFANPIVAQHRNGSIEAKRLKQLRDALLPKLMSSEIDISEVELSTLQNGDLRLSEHSDLILNCVSTANGNEGIVGRAGILDATDEVITIAILTNTLVSFFQSMPEPLRIFAKMNHDKLIPIQTVKQASVGSNENTEELPRLALKQKRNLFSEGFDFLESSEKGLLVEAFFWVTKTISGVFKPSCIGQTCETEIRGEYRIVLDFNDMSVGFIKLEKLVGLDPTFNTFVKETLLVAKLNLLMSLPCGYGGAYSSSKSCNS